MRAVVPGANVRLLARALHALARIGDDITLESCPETLTFKALDRSEAAFCAMTFKEPFFILFDVDSEQERKVSSKSALAAFRSASRVESCEIELGDSLVFRLKCKHGTLETHKLNVDFGAKIDACISNDGCKNVLTFSKKSLQRSIEIFRPQDDRIQLQVSLSGVKLFNHCDDSNQSQIRTSLTLEIADFDEFKVVNESKIAFSMRDLKTLANFADKCDLPINLKFDRPGGPATFVISDQATFEAKFIVATEREEFIETQDSKIQHIFKRCFDETVDYCRNRNVLAWDSDGEC